MQIYISRNGERYGPYTEQQLREHLASGAVVAEDLAWQEGQSDWVPVSTLFPEARPQGLQFSGSEEPAAEQAPSRMPRFIPTVQPAAEPKRNYNWVYLLALIFLLGAYIGWPYLSFSRFRAALRSGEISGLKSHIDFPAVRDSMKEQLQPIIQATLDKLKQDSRMKNNPMGANLADMVAKTLQKSLDEALTPEGLSEAIKNSKNSQKGMLGSDSWLKEDGLEWSKLEKARFSSPTGFYVQVKDAKLRFSFTGLGWKLKKIEINQDAIKKGMSALNPG